MATTSRNSINVLTINTKDSQLLRDLYAYDFLEIAIQENIVWVKNIPEGLIKTATIQRIPSQSMYTAKEGLLYPYGKQIPIGDVPDLNWQAIQKKLVVLLPSINPNYFGVQASVPVQLVPSSAAEKKGLFLLVNLADLKAYLKTVAAWRLDSLSWTVIGNYHALIKGTPMVAIQGKPYWKRGQHILPLGWDLEWPLLSTATAKRLDPAKRHWIFWQKNSQYNLIPKAHFKPLSRSSFHFTQEQLSSSNPS
ncbi:MAG: hypothetical protein AB8E82_00200 [Aureispira sp.]